jgi:ABC-type polysaccharide/polyol phosphate transport system ATPase subunit
VAPILEVASVSKTFRVPHVRRRTIREHALDWFRPAQFDELRVLDAVSIAVSPGETLGIMGRNGCGKSTLLKIISGIYQPDSGRVVVQGNVTPILELGVGWNPSLDAVDNIRLIGVVMGMSIRQIRDTMEEILDFAELTRFANVKLQHYSSGMASRLAYAVAFAAVREILVLDEVFAVGDAGFKAKCEARYRELHTSGRTIVLVSHDLGAVSGFCQRAILLENGRILAEGNGRSIADAYLKLLRGQPTSHAPITV